MKLQQSMRETTDGEIIGMLHPSLGQDEEVLLGNKEAVVFRIQWKNEFCQPALQDGKQIITYMESEAVKTRHPQMLIRFYESRLKIDNVNSECHKQRNDEDAGVFKQVFSKVIIEHDPQSIKPIIDYDLIVSALKEDQQTLAEREKLHRIIFFNPQGLSTHQNQEMVNKKMTNFRKKNTGKVNRPHKKLEKQKQNSLYRNVQESCEDKISSVKENTVQEPFEQGNMGSEKLLENDQGNKKPIKQDKESYYTQGNQQHEEIRDKSLNKLETNQQKGVAFQILCNDQVEEKLEDKSSNNCSHTICEATILDHQQGKKKSEHQQYPTLAYDSLYQLVRLWSDAESDFEENERTMSLQIELHPRDLKTLSHKNWLNDNVVNSYIRLINQKLLSANSGCLILDTLFTTSVFGFDKKEEFIYRSLDKKDVSSQKILVFAINSMYHWFFVKVQSQTAHIYDSLKKSDSNGYTNHALIRRLIAYLGIYLNRNIQLKLCEDFPQQTNLYDCGVFMLLGIKDVVRRKQQNWSFSQQDTKFKRVEIGVQLLENKISGFQHSKFN